MADHGRSWQIMADHGRVRMMSYKLSTVLYPPISEPEICFVPAKMAVPSLRPSFGLHEEKTLELIVHKFLPPKHRVPAVVHVMEDNFNLLFICQ